MERKILIAYPITFWKEDIDMLPPGNQGAAFQGIRVPGYQDIRIS
jgi:hypothetical protein